MCQGRLGQWKVSTILMGFEPATFHSASANCATARSQCHSHVLTNPSFLVLYLQFRHVLALKWYEKLCEIEVRRNSLVFAPCLCDSTDLWTALALQHTSYCVRASNCQQLWTARNYMVAVSTSHNTAKGPVSSITISFLQSLIFVLSFMVRLYRKQPHKFLINVCM